MNALDLHSDYSLNKNASVEFESLPTTHSWLDAFAKNRILNYLSQLQFGHLMLEDGNEILRFGEAADSTDLVAQIVVTHPHFYRQLMLGGSIGAGEAYMQAKWHSPDLVKVIRLICANMQVLTKLDSRWSWALNGAAWIAHKFNKNSKTNSKKNIAAHYDLSNEFFSLFLDKTMLYSAAIFKNQTTDLFAASQFKMQHICERLKLNADDHLIEIGSGWGGMAIYAAKHFGCRVTTVTLSKQQFDYAKKWIAQENLTDKITLLLQDYRDIQGKFDKLLSIEMIEAVGCEYYSTYFKKCSDLLKPNGLMLIQAITIPDQRYDYARTHTDFIQRYIFPGGCLPSNHEIARQTALNTDLQIIGVEDITYDYAKTLNLWRDQFMQQLDEVKRLGFDESFIRMWEYYLCYCEGGFEERVINTAQYLFAKPKAKSLPRVN